MLSQFNINTAIFSMQVAQDGYVLAGISTSNNGDTDVIAVKTDLNGTGKWAYTYRGQKDDYGYSIALANNGYVIAGYARSFGNGGSDGYLVKIGEDGSLMATVDQGLPVSTIILSIIAIVCAGIAIFIIWKWILKK